MLVYGILEDINCKLSYFSHIKKIIYEKISI